MRVNRGSTDGGSSDQSDGAAGMSAPTSRSNETQGSGGSGGMRAPSGGTTQRQGEDQLRSRTDRGNQNDEDIGSSASRGGGGKENAPRPEARDLDPIPDTPDVTGTTDALGG
jgi:hypothetical protein